MIIKAGLTAVIILSYISLCGCMQTYDETADGINKETVQAMTEYDFRNDNVEMLLKAAPFTDKDAVAGAADRLMECGCGKIISVNVTDDTDQVYSLTVADDAGTVFMTVMSSEGYIGPVRNEKGEYLYMPVD